MYNCTSSLPQLRRNLVVLALMNLMSAKVRIVLFAFGQWFTWYATLFFSFYDLADLDAGITIVNDQTVRRCQVRVSESNRAMSLPNPLNPG